MTNINDRVVSLWEAWRKTGDSGTLAKLMKELEPQINGAVYKYLHSGLPEAAVRAEAKRLTLDALESYDPAKGTLKNYIAVYLQKLYRYVNNYQNVVRMPENHRIAYGELLRAEDEFRLVAEREPTIADMADKLGWDPARISLLKKRFVMRRWMVWILWARKRSRRAETIFSRRARRLRMSSISTCCGSRASLGRSASLCRRCSSATTRAVMASSSALVLSPGST